MKVASEMQECSFEILNQNDSQEFAAQSTEFKFPLRSDHSVIPIGKPSNDTASPPLEHFNDSQ